MTGDIMEIVDRSVINSAFQRMRRHSSYSYTDGCVITPYGIVVVYWDYGNKHPMLRLDFVAHGKLWMGYRYKDVKKLTPRGIARIAHKFAKEMSM